MSNQQLVAELLRKAADAISCGTTVPVTVAGASSAMVGSTHIPISDISANVRAIFSPYSHPNPRRGNGKSRAKAPMSYWTPRFCLLASTSEESGSSRDERKHLYDACLGDKKISFRKDRDPAYFETKLEEMFPQLKCGRAFELLRSGIRSRVFLERIRMPPGRFTSAYLAVESNLGQAVCYIRPIQTDLDLSALIDCQEAPV